MPIATSANVTKTLKNDLDLQDFDGTGLKRPSDLPAPTAESKQKLLELLSESHRVYNLLYSEGLRYHNHTPHVLLTMFYLGCSAQQLEEYFRRTVKSLYLWKNTPSLQVTDQTWGEHIADKPHIRGYFDFYTEKTGGTNNEKEWRSLIKEYLTKPFTDEKTGESRRLLDGIFGGLMHTVIHLGYAIEFKNEELAVEAITLATTEYDNYGLDRLIGTKSEGIRSFWREEPVRGAGGDRVLHILEDIREDRRLDAGGEILDLDEFFAGLALKQDLIGDYVDRLVITEKSVDGVLRELYHAAVVVTFTSYKDEDAKRGRPCYSFFILHLLTGLHGMVEIWGSVSGKEDVVISTGDFVRMVRDYWVMFIGVYLFQLRPQFKEARVEATIEAFGQQEVSDQTRVWGQVHRILFGDGRTKVDYDCHILKCIRCLLFAQEYLKDEYGDASVYAKMAFVMASTMAGREFVGFPGKAGLMLDVVRAGGEGSRG